MYEIESSRTYLRRFSMADLDSVAKMESDHDVMKSTGPGRALSRNESEERLVKIIDSEEMDLPLGIWAAILKENHKVVGWFMLKKTSYDYPELGFMLSKKYWNIQQKLLLKHIKKSCFQKVYINIKCNLRP